MIELGSQEVKVITGADFTVINIHVVLTQVYTEC